MFLCRVVCSASTQRWTMLTTVQTLEGSPETIQLDQNGVNANSKPRRDVQQSSVRFSGSFLLKRSIFHPKDFIGRDAFSLFFRTKPLQLLQVSDARVQQSLNKSRRSGLDWTSLRTCFSLNQRSVFWVIVLKEGGPLSQSKTSEGFLCIFALSFNSDKFLSPCRWKTSPQRDAATTVLCCSSGVLSMRRWVRLRHGVLDGQNAPWSTHLAKKLQLICHCVVFNRCLLPVAPTSSPNLSRFYWSCGQIFHLPALSGLSLSSWMLLW